jgi:hypothetical protein
MTAERLFPSGAWRISAMHDGHLVTRVYYYYTKREALAEFRHEMKGR